MSASVAILPTRAAEQAAWSRYQALVIERQGNPALESDYAHSVALMRAHKEWSDIFLKLDSRC